MKRLVHDGVSTSMGESACPLAVGCRCGVCGGGLTSAVAVAVGWDGGSGDRSGERDGKRHGIRSGGDLEPLTFWAGAASGGEVTGDLRSARSSLSRFWSAIFSPSVVLAICRSLSARSRVLLRSSSLTKPLFDTCFLLTFAAFVSSRITPCSCRRRSCSLSSSVIAASISRSSAFARCATARLYHGKSSR